MQLLRPLLRLTRIDSSLLGSLAIFLPLSARTGEVAQSFGKASPVLLICMCTFIANDLDDLEKDRVNHPDRPLPAGQIAPEHAAILYFACLALALFLTRHFVDERIAFWYYALLAISISYGYLVESLPSLKAPYVAAAIAVPVLIVAASYPEDSKLWIVATSVFMAALGREMCMDIQDRPGDAISWLHRIPARPLATAAFVFQGAGILLLASQARRLPEFVDIATMLLLLTMAGACWFKRSNYSRAIFLMKIQFLLGLYFLVD